MISISIPNDPTTVLWDPQEPDSGGVIFWRYRWEPGYTHRRLGTLIIACLVHMWEQMERREIEASHLVPPSGWMGPTDPSLHGLTIKCVPMENPDWIFVYGEIPGMLEMTWAFSERFSGRFPNMIQYIFGHERGSYGKCTWASGGR